MNFQLENLSKIHLFGCFASPTLSERARKEKIKETQLKIPTPEPKAGNPSIGCLFPPPGGVGAGNSAKLSMGIGGKKRDRKRRRASQVQIFSKLSRQENLGWVLCAHMHVYKN